jgi:chorismate synthase
MSGNTFGKLLRLTTFGESHGNIIGGVLDGFPPDIIIDYDLIDLDMKRRQPGQSDISTSRKEADKVEIISGVSNDKSTGAPIAFFIKNTDVRPQDYKEVETAFRPSHADYTYYKKYGVSGITGGGRSSARETAARVAAGAIAKCYLTQFGIKIHAYTSGVGDVDLAKDYKNLDLKLTESNSVRCPDAIMAESMEKLILDAKESGDSIGGRVTAVIFGLAAGIGEPVFDKLQAALAGAMLSIPAAKGFEYGSGFGGSYMKGSNHNDEFVADKKGNISTVTNFSGGIQGGISNGNDIYFRVAFKPVSSIFKTQKTVDVNGKNVELTLKGRHDSCIVPRAVPVVEAMAALVVADFIIAAGSRYLTR